MNYRKIWAHRSALVDDDCVIGAFCMVRAFTIVEPYSNIGERCELGQHVAICTEATLGKRVTIGNHVTVPPGLTLEDDVLCGPGVVFAQTNAGRASLTHRNEPVSTVVRRGAALGANATIGCGVTIGQYALVEAGAVVRSDVPDYAIVAGTPAVQTGWAGRHGQRLAPSGQAGIYVCPVKGWRYHEEAPGQLRCLHWPEGERLPET